LSSLELVPLAAVDIRHGLCVRLRQGNFDQETVFGDDPLQCARRWEQEGAPWLHVVDLDGARDGVRRNAEAIAAILTGVKIPVQVGGGLRTLAAARELLDEGAARVVVGTAAVEVLSQLGEWVAALSPDRLVVGVDVRDGTVVTHGWETATGLDTLSFCRTLVDVGVKRVLFTDVRRDGVLAGPNVDGVRALVSQTGLLVQASGGVTTLDDVRALAAAGAEGAIIGRALYDGRLRLPDVLEALRLAPPSLGMGAGGMGIDLC
jgi:phosphoribosylformimino-5-aminoimidazole carboxamide ribotide isomerase